MKKILVTLSMLIIASLSSLPAFAIDGDGTEETPFLITDQAELELVTDFPDCHFKLINDIEMEGTWIPLCKQTSSGSFSGVFDGDGYTISNLITDGSEGGLFKDNTGIIKNLNIIIAEEGMIGSGAISDINSGTISNCVIKGNISGSFSNIGGICSINNETITQCKFEGNIENTNGNGYIGGICGDNKDIVSSCAVTGNVTGKSYSGGISGRNYENAHINDCYFIGEVNSSSSYKGGIVGYNNYSYISSGARFGYITDCYAVPTFNSGGYGISYIESKYIETSYYDKTISGLTDTSYGTPKSTAAMKMKQTYIKYWDFDTIWGIDKNINNGYPYLLWEYPDVAEESPYTVNNVKITDLSGSEITEIPDGSFNFEINVTKNDNSKNVDSLIIAIYDEADTLIDVKYMNGVYYQNQTINFGTTINEIDKKIGNIKSFVWDSLSGMTPLSNTIELVD